MFISSWQTRILIFSSSSGSVASRGALLLCAGSSSSASFFLGFPIVPKLTLTQPAGHRDSCVGHFGPHGLLAHDA